jgi:hypothetical protein
MHENFKLENECVTKNNALRVFSASIGFLGFCRLCLFAFNIKAATVEFLDVLAAVLDAMHGNIFV